MAWTRAEETYFAAKERYGTIRAGLRDMTMPRRLLHPEETVHGIAVGSVLRDEFPVLLITDRRVLIVRDGIRGWKIRSQAPSADVAGAELEDRLLSRRLRVRLRTGKDLTLKVRDRERSEAAVDLIRHLVAGGAPPR